MAKYDKEQLLADWRTGDYTQRSLAHKHKISNAMAAKLTKGVPKNNSKLISSLIDDKQSLRKKSEQEVSAINEIVSREDAKRIKAEKISSFIDTGLGLAAKKGVELVQDSDATMQDVNGFGKFALDAKKSLGTLEEKPTTVISQNNDNSTKTNVMQVPIMSQEDWNKKAAESQEKLINEQ